MNPSTVPKPRVRRKRSEASRQQRVALATAINSAKAKTVNSFAARESIAESIGGQLSRPAKPRRRKSTCAAIVDVSSALADSLEISQGPAKETGGNSAASGHETFALPPPPPPVPPLPRPPPPPGPPPSSQRQSRTQEDSLPRAFQCQTCMPIAIPEILCTACMEIIPTAQILSKAKTAAASRITREQWACFFVSIGRKEQLQHLNMMMTRCGPLELVERAKSEFGASPLTAEAVLAEWKNNDRPGLIPQPNSPMCDTCSQRQQHIAGKDQHEVERMNQWLQSRHEKTWECSAKSDTTQMQQDSNSNAKLDSYPTNGNGDDRCGWMGHARDLVCGACGARGPGAEDVVKAIEAAKQVDAERSLDGPIERTQPQKRKGRLKRSCEQKQVSET